MGVLLQVSDNSDLVSIHPTEIELDAMADLRSARSKISILTNKAHFNQSAMTIRCDASIFTIWRRSVESTIRDDSPKLAQVLGSTLSQSQKDPILGRRKFPLVFAQAALFANNHYFLLFVKLIILNGGRSSVPSARSN